MVQVRRACLITLEKLRLKALSNNITYLKSRNILPLFYFFLQDVDAEIKSVNRLISSLLTILDGSSVNIFIWTTRRAHAH